MPELDETRSRERLQKAVGADYRVGRLMGKGGFAEVFEADEPRLSRRVAIKVVRDDLIVSEDVLERFQREARAMAALRHPNVMEVYTVGRGEGIAYFVMPLVSGESLASRIAREGSLPIETSLRVVSEIASALLAAHRAGIVHRDVKPDNILLEGEAARVLITDFGIAKAIAGDSGPHTISSVTIGTPQYMSPEQSTGEDFDHRTDIYSLGLVAFEMVSGRPAFEAKSPQALIAKHLTEPAPPLRGVRPDCPERLARVVERCLAKDPGERWANLNEVLTVLQGPDEAARVVATSEAEAATAPLRKFRRMALRTAAAVGAFAIADVIFGLAGLSPWLVLVAGGFLAVRAGTLWREGYEWPQLLGISEIAANDVSPHALEEDFGRFRTLVRGVVASRAAIMKAYAAAPHQERNRHASLQPTVEGLVNRSKHLARTVINLEQRIAELTQRMEPSHGPGGSSSTGYDAMGPDRHAVRLHELNAARDDAARELHACIARLEGVRDRLTDDARPSSDDLARRLSESAAYLSQRAI